MFGTAEVASLFDVYKSAKVLLLYILYPFHRVPTRPRSNLTHLTWCQSQSLRTAYYQGREQTTATAQQGNRRSHTATDDASFCTHIEYHLFDSSSTVCYATINSPKSLSPEAFNGLTSALRICWTVLKALVRSDESAVPSLCFVPRARTKEVRGVLHRNPGVLLSH
jgi:hypothetical protein